MMGEPLHTFPESQRTVGSRPRGATRTRSGPTNQQFSTIPAVTCDRKRQQAGPLALCFAGYHRGSCPLDEHGLFALGLMLCHVVTAYTQLTCARARTPAASNEVISDRPGLAQAAELRDGAWSSSIASSVISSASDRLLLG